MGAITAPDMSAVNPRELGDCGIRFEFLCVINGVRNLNIYIIPNYI